MTRKHFRNIAPHEVSTLAFFLTEDCIREGHVRWQLKYYTRFIKGSFDECFHAAFHNFYYHSTIIMASAL